MTNPIQAENSLPGTPDWRLTAPVAFEDREEGTFRTKAIEGYASLTSVNVGDEIAFHVSTAADAFHIRFYRMGWYGGVGGREVLTTGVLSGQLQNTLKRDDQPPNDGLVECDWEPSYSLLVPQNWISGIYLAKLIAKSPVPAEHSESYMIFVVRDDSRASDYLMQSSVMTYQAYNGWGARSFYGYNSLPNLGNGRTGKVSFNRPYFAGHRIIKDSSGETYGGTTPHATGSGHFFVHYPSPLPEGKLLGEVPWHAWEYNAVRWLERNGYDVTYCTNIDVHRDWRRLFSHKAFLSVGHDEYWTREMRFHVELARDQGIDILFLGGNSVFCQSRLDPDSKGNPHRTLVCYKDRAPSEPHRDEVAQRIEAGTATHDDLYPYSNTASEFRSSSWPETALTGSTLVNITWDGPEDLEIRSPSDWIFAGTGASAGDLLDGMGGYETDGDLDSLNGNHAPANRRVLASAVSPYWPSGKVLAYGTDGGATVFSAGSIQWCWGLDDFTLDLTSPRVPATENPVVQRMTANLLARAARTTGAEMSVYRSDGSGGIHLLGSAGGWRTKWRIIPGRFGSAGGRDVLLYDPTTGEGFFYAIGDDGSVEPIGNGSSGWRRTWRIVPGHFSPGPLTDLLFYDPAEGEAAFYRPTGNGGIEFLGELHTGWRRTWRIIPGRFNAGPFTDLLLYDPAHGHAAFYQVDGSGGIQQLPVAQPITHTDWRQTWQIVAGTFSAKSADSGRDDLLFYDRRDGRGAFYHTSGMGQIQSFDDGIYSWRRTWTIIPGKFGPGSLTDVLLYDPTVGEGWFFSSDQNGTLSPINSKPHRGWRRTWQIAPLTSNALFTDLLFYDSFAAAP